MGYLRLSARGHILKELHDRKWVGFPRVWETFSKIKKKKSIKKLGLLLSMIFKNIYVYIP